MKRWLFSNIELKIFSLLIAVTLWILVRGEQRTDIYVNVKVELKNVPSHLIVTNKSRESLNIHLNGPKQLLAKINEKYFEPYLCDLAKASSGEFTCMIEQSQLKTDEGVNVVDVTPREIVMKIETVMTKKVSIVPDIVGGLEPGYELEGFDVYPENVTLIGPRSVVNFIEELKTGAIDISRRKRSFVDKVPLVLPSEFLQIEEETDLAVVNVKIREESLSTIMDDVPLRLEDETGLWRLKSLSTQVKVSGIAGKVNDVRKEEIEIVALVPPGKENQLRAEAELKIKEIEGVTITNLAPVYVLKKDAKRVR